MQTFIWGGASNRRTTELWLYPELDGSAVVGGLDTDDSAEQLEYYVDWVKRKHPDWCRDDAVPIHWVVRGDGIFEAALCKA